MTGAPRRLSIMFGAFVFVGVLGTILPAEFPEARIAAHLLYGVPLAVWAVLRLGRRRTALDIPIAAALVAFLVVALLSRDVQGSLEMLAGALVWALLFWLMTDVRAPATRGALAMGAAGAITAWLAIFAVRWGTEKATWVANGGGMPNLVESTQTLFWLTTNVVPVLVLLGIGVLAYLPSDAAGRLIRWPFLALSIVTVPMSGGRAGWLGLVVAGAALLLLNGPDRLRRLRTSRGVAIGLGAAAVAAVVLMVTVGDRALDASGLTARLPLWNGAISILTTDPLTGGGPGTYSWLRLEHVPAYHAPVAAILAHNVVLQTLADGGVVLTAGLAAVIGALLVAAFRSRRALAAAERQALAVLIGFGAVSLLDDHSALPAIAAIVVTLAAWVATGSEADSTDAPTGDRGARRPADSRRLAMLAVIAVVAVASVPAAARVDLARLEAQAGRVAALRGDYGRAAEAFDRAIALYPDRANYHLSAGLVLAMDGRADDARAHYARATELAPADARAWAAMSALVPRDDGVELARRAAEAPNLDPRFAYSYAEILSDAGDPDALLSFARAVAKSSTTIAALTETVGDAEAVAAAVLLRIDELAAEARTDPDEIRWDLALAGLVPADDLGPAWRAVRALQDGDIAAARAAADEAIASDPLSSRTWLAAGAVAEHRCDDDAAASARALAALTPGGVSRGRAEPIYRSNDLAYREPGLASYQPVPPPYDPAALDWPAAFLTPPSCGS